MHQRSSHCQVARQVTEMLADSRSPRDAVIGGTPPPDVAGLGTKWESRVLTAARYSSSPLTCARGSPAETRKRPGGGDVDAFLGVKWSPVHDRPPRMTRPPPVLGRRFNPAIVRPVE